MKRNPVFKSIIVSVALSAVLAGCGSSSNSSDDTQNDKNIKSTQIRGKAVDGYLKFATVCLDLNKDGYCQAVEPMTSTNEDGSFTLEIKPEVKNQKGFDEAMLLVYGGVDVDTGDDFKGKLLAPADSEEISVTPLTTIVAKMVQDELKNSDKLTKDQIKQTVKLAKAKVAEFLDIDPEDLTKDPVALKDKKPKLIKEALKIQKAIEAHKIDADSDEIEAIYDKLAQHLVKVDADDIEDKGAQILLKDVLNDDKAIEIAKNIDTAFEDFNGDLQKVSHITKEDLRKIKKGESVARAKEEWEKFKKYTDEDWSDEFIKGDLEDIGIVNISDDDIKKIKEKIGSGVKVRPGIVKEIKDKLKKSDDEFDKQIFEKIKEIEIKKGEKEKIVKVIESDKNTPFKAGVTFYDLHHDGYSKISLLEDGKIGIDSFNFENEQDQEQEEDDIEYRLIDGQWKKFNEKDDLSYKLNSDGTIDVNGMIVTMKNIEDISGKKIYIKKLGRSVLMPQGAKRIFIMIKRSNDRYTLYNKVDYTNETQLLSKGWKVRVVDGVKIFMHDDRHRIYAYVDDQLMEGEFEKAKGYEVDTNYNKIAIEAIVEDVKKNGFEYKDDNEGASSSTTHNPIKKAWTKDSVVEAFANKKLFFVDAKKIGEDKVYQIIELDFDSNAVATYNDGDQEVKVKIYADKYKEDIFPYMEMARGNFSESSLMDRETKRYIDFNFYDEFDNEQLFYRNLEDAKKRLEELEKKDADKSYYFKDKQNVKINL